MSSMNCIPTPTISTATAATATAAEKTPGAATTKLTTFKVSESVYQASPFLQLADTYAAYADNFDLSLLPQDCTNPTENIPTTVYQYTTTTNNNNNNTDNSSSTTLKSEVPPQIKIEQTWPHQTIVDEIKKETSYEQINHHSHPPSHNPRHHPHPHPHHHHQNLQQQQQQFSKTSNQLTLPPPPAYPQLYPSPQSSPAQSEYAFPHNQYAGCYDSLSSSRTSLYPLSPCSSVVDTNCIKQELHILPPSPPESNCEAPSPHSSCSADIKIESFDSEAEAWIDLNTLLEKSRTNFGDLNRHQPQQPQQNLPNSNSPASSIATLAPPASIIQQHHHHQQQQQQQQQQDHQLLREYLEDTTFQRKHNLKPLALDSFIGGLEAVRDDIEPVISLAFEHAKREADEISAKLQISQDPSVWSSKQVHDWLRYTIEQFKLPQIDDLEIKFNEDGAALILLSEEEFIRRVPESGSTLHAQLDVWKMAFNDRCQDQMTVEPSTQNHENMVTLNSRDTPINGGSSWNSSCISTINMDLGEESDDGGVVDDDDDDDEAMLPTTTITTISNPTIAAADILSTVADVSDQKRIAGTTAGGRNGGSHIHLWQFLKELLSAPHINGTAIRWIDRTKGIFKIEDSVRVAKLWGRRKNRPAMNYDKLSRSIRQYYKKGIMKKTERSQRLVYQFCHPYHL